jgi:hypothetical protein
LPGAGFWDFGAVTRPMISHAAPGNPSRLALSRRARLLSFVS